MHFGQPLEMGGLASFGRLLPLRARQVALSRLIRFACRRATRRASASLYAREGKWGDERILSRHWVRRSSALYSIDDEVMGYGFMWWVMREPRFEQYGMYAALGVGNQMIAVLPDIDVVIVNRANTYRGEGTPTKALLDLIEQVLEARTGEASAKPRLVPLEAAADDPRATSVSVDVLEPFVGKWSYPPASLGMGSRTSVEVKATNGHLVTFSPNSGTFELYLQADGTLIEEDSWERYIPVRTAAGEVDGIADAATVAAGALVAAASENGARASALLESIPEDEETALPSAVTKQLVALLGGKATEAEAALESLTERSRPGQVGADHQRQRLPPHERRAVVGSAGGAGAQHPTLPGVGQRLGQPGRGAPEPRQHGGVHSLLREDARARR